MNRVMSSASIRSGCARVPRETAKAFICAGGSGFVSIRLRGPCGAHDEFHLAATAQNLRKLAKLLALPQNARPA